MTAIEAQRNLGRKRNGRTLEIAWMRQFSGLDLQRQFARVRDAALREPVAIIYDGRTQLVLMDISEFERLKRRDKQVVDVWHLPEEFCSALVVPYQNDEQDALDWLLD